MPPVMLLAFLNNNVLSSLYMLCKTFYIQFIRKSIEYKVLMKYCDGILN